MQNLQKIQIKDIEIDSQNVNAFFDILATGSCNYLKSLYIIK